MTPKYSMLIEWSEDNDAFIVTLPDFPCNRTHGTSYEEAAHNGREVLDLLIETYQADGKTLPVPRELYETLALA